MYVVTILSLITYAVATFEDDIFAGNDPKVNYFRYVRTYAQSDDTDGAKLSSSEAGDIPKPLGFRIYYPANSKRAIRTRRQDPVSATITTTTTSLPTVSSVIQSEDISPFDDELKPLQLDILDADNYTDSSGIDDAQGNDLVINDFIRFRRDVERVDIVAKQPEELKAEKSADNVRPKREHERREGKMLLAPEESLPEGTSREPRGLVKEQWLKQPYQIQAESSNRNYEEGSQPGEPANAPRVHFVTQRRSESVPPLVYHSYDREREGRSRDLTRQRDIDLDRDFEPAYYPRAPRHYNSQFGDGYPRWDAFSRAPDRERDFGRERDSIPDRSRGRYHSNQDRYYEEDRPVPTLAKQKRIIYYATLPDVTSRQPGLDRDRERERNRERDPDRERNFRRYRPDDHYSERDRDLERDRVNRLPSEDRYAAQPFGGGSSAINYRFRNESPYESRDKSRYDEATAKTAAYPTKVSSTDVNVRALKKNPERRIYSEVERRYPYKADYHHDDGSASYDGNHR